MAKRKAHSLAELRDIARNIMEDLRPEHLTVGEIQQVAMLLSDMTGNIVLREWPGSDEFEP